jgi:hypothetical protein
MSIFANTSRASQSKNAGEEENSGKQRRGRRTPPLVLINDCLPTASSSAAHATDEHLLLAFVGSDLVESFLCWRSSSSTRSSEVLAERSLRWREAPPPHARRRRACGAVPALVGGVLAEPSSRSSEAFL